MSKVIIGIHGLGNKPNRETLNDWWIEAINEGFKKAGRENLSIPFELVYWADLLHEYPLNIIRSNPLKAKLHRIHGSFLSKSSQ